MTTGMIFDIREFAVHDGPGIRTTVFLKGCPLSCTWCHNPEGQSFRPQIMRSPGRERLAGTSYTTKALAAILNRQAAVLKANEGGVTFSGGEPLMQADFLAETIELLDGIHVLLDTSGCGDPQDFRLLLERTQLVFYDLKIIDRQLHQRFTGCDNDRVLENLQILAASGVPYVIRVPLVPGVTDTPINLSAIARTVGGLPGLVRVDLLTYNKAAGAKYAAAGMKFEPGYDESQPVNLDLAIFENAGIKVRAA
jgi:pyruvate formate lyase activating enzyme